MAFRFRRTAQLFPGFRVNLGKRGISLSAGARGANMTLGRNGLFANAGMPGTGMSMRSKVPIDGAAKTNSRRVASGGDGSFSVRLSLSDDGSVVLTDDDGGILSAKHQRLVREQQGEMIREWLSEQCERWNESIDNILNLHLDTPDPSQQISYDPLVFNIDRPSRPQERFAGFFGMLSTKRKQVVADENAEALREFEASLSEWETLKAQHEKTEEHKRWLIEEGRNKSRENMEEFLELILGDIDWPRDTDVSFEVTNDCRTVFLDVDLPEVEDMTTESATVASRGFKINVKKRSETQIRKEYMAHIHAVGFRVVGEVFAALPRVTCVVCSGYSQRPDKQTGHLKDDYLFSVSVDREKWSKLNFDNLDMVDHIAYFEIFGIRRDVSKTGVFKPIEPIAIQTEQTH
jgi:hypothetical protein